METEECPREPGASLDYTSPYQEETNRQMVFTLILRSEKTNEVQWRGSKKLLIKTFSSSEGRKTEGTGSAKALIPCPLASFRCANDCGLPGLLKSSADFSPVSFWISH